MKETLGARAARYRAERDLARQRADAAERDAEAARRERDAARESAAMAETVRGEVHDAYAWVKEYGGLEKVREDAVCWNTAEHVVDDLFSWMGRVCPKLGIDRCGYGIALDAVEAAIDRRLMPEGMEWPRFADGGPVRIGDEWELFAGGTDKVRRVSFESDGAFMLNESWYDSRARLDRHAPKAYGADGAEIREGRDVWWICEGDGRGAHAERLCVKRVHDDGMLDLEPYGPGTSLQLESCEVYTLEPVLAADGKPVLIGERVWIDERLMPEAMMRRGSEFNLTGAVPWRAFTVLYVKGATAYLAQSGWHCPASWLTHERPTISDWALRAGAPEERDE